MDLYTGEPIMYLQRSI